MQALEFNPVFFKTIFLDMVHAPKKTWMVMSDVLEKMENYLDEHLKTFVQPVIRLLEKKEEITHYDLKDHFNDIRLPLDMREFVEMGLLRQTEATFRFTKKSSAEMMQPAYQLTYRESGPKMMVEDSMILL